MKIDEIKTIVKLMADNDLTEFKIEADECNLCIRRGSPQTFVSSPILAASAAPVIAAAPIPTVAPTVSVPAAAPAAATPAAAAPAEAVKRITIDSPIVGTFYRSSSPDSPAFANIGDTVTPDTVVCIIEAMKVMNEIKAEKAGVIKEILVENATPVEFGQPIFVIE